MDLRLALRPAEPAQSSTVMQSLMQSGVERLLNTSNFGDVGISLTELMSGSEADCTLSASMSCQFVDGLH